MVLEKADHVSQILHVFWIKSLLAWMPMDVWILFLLI